VKRDSWSDELRTLQSRAKAALIRHLPEEILHKLDEVNLRSRGSLTNDEDTVEQSENPVLEGLEEESGLSAASSATRERKKIAWKVDYFILGAAIQDLEEYYKANGVEVRNIFGMPTHPVLVELIDLKKQYEDKFLFAVEAAKVLLRAHVFELPAATRTVQALHSDIGRYRRSEVSLQAAIQHATAALTRACARVDIPHDFVLRMIAKTNQRGALRGKNPVDVSQQDLDAITRFLAASFEPGGSSYARLIGSLCNLLDLVHSPRTFEALQIAKRMLEVEVNSLQALYQNVAEAQDSPFPGVPKAWGPPSARSQRLEPQGSLVSIYSTLQKVINLGKVDANNVTHELSQMTKASQSVRLIAAEFISKEGQTTDGSDEIDWSLDDTEEDPCDALGESCNSHPSEPILPAALTQLQDENLLQALLDDFISLQSCLRMRLNEDSSDISSLVKTDASDSRSTVSRTVVLATIATVKRAARSSASTLTYVPFSSEAQSTSSLQALIATLDQAIVACSEALTMVGLAKSAQAQVNLANEIVRTARKMTSLYTRLQHARQLANEAQTRLAFVRVQANALSSHVKNVKGRLERGLASIPGLFGPNVSQINIMGRFDFVDIPDETADSSSVCVDKLTRAKDRDILAEISELDSIPEVTDTVNALPEATAEATRTPPDHPWEEQQIEW